jgi:hypothetical protein
VVVLANHSNAIITEQQPDMLGSSDAPSIFLTSPIVPGEDEKALPRWVEALFAFNS